MQNLWLVPALPLLGFLLLAFGGATMARRLVTLIGVGSVGLSALVAIFTALDFLRAPPPNHVFAQALWHWIALDQFTPHIALYLDPLSLVMMLVVTGVGFLIHWYSAGFMSDDEGYARFFAYMNLFVAAMLTLVLGDNLLALYLGWESVGLCSYLLIGFWYREPANGYAARKAFVVTRVGDTALVIGLLLLFTQLGTLNIQELVARADQQWTIGTPLATVAAILVLGGALGKSAQLPLQTWLPDAMAGPTPVSALIHAATMVTAGVYLIARLHALFLLAPAVLLAVAIIGALTLLVAGLSALGQNDIKRILAYSTISQIGYMFLALGVGAWTAALFHFMTHAFFKALLFLSAGLVIHSLHHEHDIYKMGDLRRRLPIAFWSFGIGAASLAALPLVTAGFYSKDLILLTAWAGGGPWLWAAGWVGAVITSIYIFRAFFIAFFGPARTEVSGATSRSMAMPVIVLAVLAIIGGLVEVPPLLGHVSLFSDLLAPTLPKPEYVISASTELRLEALSILAAIAGVYVAYRLFFGASAERVVPFYPLLRAGMGFDWLYDRLIVRPFLALAAHLRSDFIDTAYRGIMIATRQAHALLSLTQTGRLRWYAMGLVVGAAFITAAVLLP